MDDRVLVGRGQRLGDPHAEQEGLARREGTAHESRGERLTLDVLHDHVLTTSVVDADVVHRADARVIERCYGLGLLEETSYVVIVGTFGMPDELDRDESVERDVSRQVDHAHAARPERADQFIVPEPLPSGEWLHYRQIR